MEINNRTNDLITQKLLLDRTILLWGEVNDDTAQHVVERLLYLDAIASDKRILLLINSPGGHVHSGFTIYDCMQQISSPVATCCTGMAASMGAIILSGGEKGQRSIMPNARVMIHQPSGGVGGSYTEIEIQLEELIKTKNIGAEILSANCGKSVKQIKEDFERDYWMNAREALDYGIVDRIGSKT